MSPDQYYTAMVNPDRFAEVSEVEVFHGGILLLVAECAAVLSAVIVRMHILMCDCLGFCGHRHVE